MQDTVEWVSVLTNDDIIILLVINGAALLVAY